MKQILEYLFNHQTLSKSEAKAILTEISMNKFNDSEVTAFITVFMMRSITLDEFDGFREALLQLCTKIDLGADDVVDIVGTGGDGKDTFNISTLASFVVAGAGQKVAKHGNYAASSVSGSSNVLEELGYKFKSTQTDLQQDLEKANICFLHAPLFHPALKTVAPLRKQLGLKTFFNLMGPLVNPAQPKYSMIGVANLEIARIYQYLLQKENKNFMLVNALDGYDEISLTADSKIFTQQGEKIFSAQDLGFENLKPREIFGGKTKAEAAKIFMSVLQGEATEAQNKVVRVNAAMALLNTEKYGNYSDCLALASESLTSKKALKAFQNLI